MLWPRPKDDRGERCELVPATGRQVLARAFGIHKRLLDEDSAKEHSITIGLEVAVGIGFGWLGFILWLAFVHPLFKPSIDNLLSTIIGSSIAIVVGLLAWWLLLEWTRRMRFGKISEIYLATGRCPSCGYSIADHPPEDDGCVVCPECAAAWNAERVSVSDDD